MMNAKRLSLLPPDGQMPAAAGAGPAAVPGDGGGVEEDAPRREAEAAGQGGEREGKRDGAQKNLMTALRAQGGKMMGR